MDLELVDCSTHPNGQRELRVGVGGNSFGFHIKVNEREYSIEISRSDGAKLAEYLIQHVERFAKMWEAEYTQQRRAQ